VNLPAAALDTASSGLNFAEPTLCQPGSGAASEAKTSAGHAKIGTQRGDDDFGFSDGPSSLFGFGPLLSALLT